MTKSSNLIDSLEVYILNNPVKVKPHWVSHFVVPTANELLIKIKNKDGNSGFGLATSYRTAQTALILFSLSSFNFFSTMFGSTPVLQSPLTKSTSILNF